MGRDPPGMPGARRHRWRIRRLVTRIVDVNGESYAQGQMQRAEGWAHVMDRHRATAVAIKDFAEAEASIETWADGHLRIRRDLGGTRKSFTFWLHFVGMPIQIGAVTSPQSMMHPLAVRVE